MSLGIVKRFRQLATDLDGFTKSDRRRIREEFQKSLGKEKVEIVFEIFDDLAVNPAEKEQLIKLLGLKDEDQKRRLEDIIGFDGKELSRQYKRSLVRKNAAALCWEGVYKCGPYLYAHLSTETIAGGDPSIGPYVAQIVRGTLGLFQRLQIGKGLRIPMYAGAAVGVDSDGLALLNGSLTLALERKKGRHVVGVKLSPISFFMRKNHGERIAGMAVDGLLYYKFRVGYFNQRVSEHGITLGLGYRYEYGFSDKKTIRNLLYAAAGYYIEFGDNSR